MANSIRLILLVLSAFCAGLVSARTVQTTVGTADIEVPDDGMFEEVVTTDVLCDVAGCNYDMQLYCLANGVIVMGSCSLKNLLCTNGEKNSLRLAEGWDTCFQATYTVTHQQGDSETGEDTHIEGTTQSPYDQQMTSRSTSHGAASLSSADEEWPAASNRFSDVLSGLEEQIDEILN